MLTIYTAQYAYPGADGVDTTLGGIWEAKKKGTPEPNGAVFAPPEWLLKGYKAWQHGGKSSQKIDSSEYEPLYVKCLRQRWQVGGKAPMLEILRRYEAEHGTIVLRCFCADGDFCHTAILRTVLLTICASEGIEAMDGGRVTRDSRKWAEALEQKHAGIYATADLF